MTEVEFHVNVPDRLQYACRLLRKAYRQGARVLVRAPAPRLMRLDRELWTFVEREFLPHACGDFLHEFEIFQRLCEPCVRGEVAFDHFHATGVHRA